METGRRWGRGGGGAWFDGRMDPEARLTQEMRAVWVTIGCFVVGAGAGMLVLSGHARPLVGDGSVGLPVASVAGVIAAASFIVSTLLHRRGETAAMPGWQRAVSTLSAVALTIAFAGVTALGVLLATEVLSVGLQGLELSTPGGGLVSGAASAVAGRLAFGAGVRLRTADLAALLFGYLIIGTLFAMLTAADPRWWELNFSQLGIGDGVWPFGGAWVFNGTLVVAGLLVATVGAYIGRDLHRLQGDAVLGRIGWTVALWALTGVALAAVGLFPLHRAEFGHHVAAVGTLVLFVAAGAVTTVVLPGPPAPLVVTTVAVGALLVVAVLLCVPFRLYSLTTLEVIVVGLGLLWVTTLVRTLAVIAPPDSRPSARPSLLHR